jgi:hypothetical protein
MEKPVTIPLGKKKVKLPLWKAWAELEARRIWGAPMSPPLDAMLSATERWQAIVEASAQSYGEYKGTQDVSGDRIERELAAVAADAEIASLAARLADDLATRLAAVEREEGDVLVDPLSGALLLLPLVRAGRPVEPRWDLLVRVSATPQSRELMSALPPARREALLWRFVRNRKPHDVAGIGDALAVLDLAPSLRIGENLAARLAHPKVRDFFDSFPPTADERLAQMRELAKKAPELRRALTK